MPVSQQGLSRPPVVSEHDSGVVDVPGEEVCASQVGLQPTRYYSPTSSTPLTLDRR